MKTMYISDKQVAALLNVSEATISRLARGETKCKESPLIGMNPVKVLGQRRWSLLEIARRMKSTPEELEAALCGGGAK